MNVLDCLNWTVSYIEQHITEEIEYKTLADSTGIPVYHFQKMFACMADVPLTEYIRRRRMSLAAEELLKGNRKIVDVALKYGYNSPTAFNRAFQSVHGVSPSMVKKGCAPAVSYPALQFSFSVKGSGKLNFRIEKKESFRILGISSPLARELEKNFKTIPHRWDQALADGTLDRLFPLMDGKSSGLMGVSVHHGEDWRYFIAVSSSQSAKGMEAYEFPAASWAVFSGEGTNKTLQELERRVITEWLPSSGYHYADIPDIEVYLKADPKACVYEYWLPVILPQSI